MKYLFSVILFVALLSSACHHDRQVDAVLSNADKIMSTDPESAYAMLDSIDCSSESSDLKAWHALLLAKANEKTFRKFRNDSLTACAADFFRGRGDSLEVQALFYNGVVHGYNRKYADALISLIEAVEKSKSLGDHFYTAMSFREQADIYGALLVDSKRLEYADSARKYFLLAGKPDYALRERLSVAESLVKLGLTDSASIVLAEARADSLITEAPAYISSYHRLMSAVLDAKGDYIGALIHLDSLSYSSSGLDSKELSLKSRLLCLIGEYDAAVEVFDEASIFAFEPEDSVELKLSEAMLAAGQKSYGRAYEAYRQFFDRYADSRQYMLNHPYTAVINEYYRQQADSRHADLQSVRVQKWTWTIIALLVAGLSVTVVVIYRRRLKDKELQSEVLLSDIRRLRESADSRRHYSVINSLCEMAGIVPETSAGYAMLGKNVSKFIDNFRTDNALNDIERYVNEQSDGLMAKFRTDFPDLSERKYKFVLLCFAGFSGQSIITVLDLKSAGAARTMRYRLKRLVDESDSPRRDLYSERL